MKKLFTLLICTFSLLLCFSSCSGEAEDVDSVNKQTILVFMPWTGSTNTAGLTTYLKDNVDSICAGIVAKKGLNNTRVMLFFSESAGQNVLYDLQYDATSRSVNRVAVKNYEGTTYNSVDGLAGIINDVKEAAPALNYSMIIGCHGCGWTQVSDWAHYPNYARPNTGSISPASITPAWQQTEPTSTDNFSGIQFGEDPNDPKTRFFGSVSWSDGSMDVTTLAQAIEKSGTKMQFIIFDACYMGNVETAYELRNATNYLIASSSEVLSIGLPYKSLWNYINSATPNYSSIVSTTVNYYSKLSNPYCNLAAIDCRQLDKLASIMKEINSKYTLSPSVPVYSIQSLDGFFPNLFYDLETYVDSLKPSGVLKDQFTAQLKATIKAAQSTPQVIAFALSSRGEIIDVNHYSGLTISDPSLHSVAIEGREKTAWWKATHNEATKEE